MAFCGEKSYLIFPQLLTIVSVFPKRPFGENLLFGDLVKDHGSRPFLHYDEVGEHIVTSVSLLLRRRR